MRFRHVPGLANPVSAIVLGTGGFGSAQPRDLSFALLDAFAEAGGTFLDTANVYAAWLPNGTGASERTIGAWLTSRGMRAQVAIGTKGGHPHLASMDRSRLRPEDISADLAESLHRLSVSAIDVYWLHRDDECIPVDEILGAMQPHVRSGVIRALGASNWSWARLEAAQICATKHGWTGFSASQVNWSLAAFSPTHRHTGGLVGMDADTLTWHACSRLAQIPYSSQANGFFAKPLAQALERHPQYDHPINRRRWTLVQQFAAQHSASPNAIALAWLLQHPQGGFGIIGPKNLTQLADSLTAARIELDPEEHAALSSDRG